MFKLLLITSLTFVFYMCTDKTTTGPDDILSSQSSISSMSSAIETTSSPLYIPDSTVEHVARIVSGKLTGDINAVSKIEAVITDKTNSEKEPYIFPLWKNAQINGYSSIVQLPNEPKNVIYSIHVRVYTNNNYITGYSSVIDFPVSAGNIELPDFNIFNSYPAITGSSIQGGTLKAVYPYSEFLIASELSYQWYRNGSPINGATNTTYSIQYADSGSVLSFSTNYKNSSIYQELHSQKANTVTGFNPPEFKNIYVSGVPRVDSILTVAYWYFDVNGDAEGGTQLQWYRDGVQVDGANDRSYIITSLDGGMNISVIVTPVALTGINLQGNQVTISSFVPQIKTLIDQRDGEDYGYVKIGDQTWLNKNLNFSSLDGTGSSCAAGLPEYCEKYGRFYRWKTVVDGLDSVPDYPNRVKGICPDGYHVPYFVEWNKLLGYLKADPKIGYYYVASLKSTTGWESYQMLGGSDAFGFNVIPVSTWNPILATETYYWTADKKAIRFSVSNSVGFSYELDGDNLFPIRCVEDSPLAIIKAPEKIYLSEEAVINGEKSLGSNKTNALSYEWSVMGKEVLSTLSSFSYLPQELGGVDITLTVSDGITTNSDTVHFVVKSKFTDQRDGNSYDYVKIGDNYWMAENLNYDTLDGNGSWCYDNDIENCNLYGRLYDWTTAMNIDSKNDNLIYSASASHKGICPDNWQMPNVKSWDDFILEVQNTSVEKNLELNLRSVSGWGANNNGKDYFGFSILNSGKSSFQLQTNGWWNNEEFNRTNAKWITTSVWGNTGHFVHQEDKNAKIHVRCFKKVL